MLLVKAVLLYLFFFFKIYALDTELGLGPGTTRSDLLSSIKGHVLAEGELMGRYSR